MAEVINTKKAEEKIKGPAPKNNTIISKGKRLLTNSYPRKKRP